jgi:HlyD family secretion protein
MKPWLIVSLIIIAIAAIAGAGYLGSRSVAVTEDSTPQAPVTVAVTRGEVQQTVTAPGQLVGTQEKLLGLKVEGQLEEITVRPGSVVQAGEVLARLDIESLQEKLAEAQLELSRAETDLAHQQAEARLNLQIAEGRLKQAETQLSPMTAAEADLKAAQAKLERLLTGPGEDEITAAAAELRQSQLALKQAQWDYDQVAYAGDIGARPEAARLEEATLAYEASLAAYNQAVQGADAADIAGAEAEVQRAKVDVMTKQAQLEANRQEIAILEVEVQQARLKLEQLQAGVDPLLEQAVAKAEQELANATLTAPFGGVVLEVLARPGERATPEKGIILLADPSAAEVEVKVIEEDLPLIRFEQPAELFFDATPDEAIQGYVSRIVPQRLQGEDRPLYAVYIRPTHLPEGVVPGMTVDASIIVDQRTEVARLPRALARPNSQGLAQVKVWTNNHLEERDIRVGLRGDVYVEILEGIEVGELVAGE